MTMTNFYCCKNLIFPRIVSPPFAVQSIARSSGSLSQWWSCYQQNKNSEMNTIKRSNFKCTRNGFRIDQKKVWIFMCLLTLRSVRHSYDKLSVINVCVYRQLGNNNDMWHPLEYVLTASRASFECDSPMPNKRIHLSSQQWEDFIWILNT